MDAARARSKPHHSSYDASRGPSARTTSVAALDDAGNARAIARLPRLLGEPGAAVTALLHSLSRPGASGARAQDSAVSARMGHRYLCVSRVQALWTSSGAGAGASGSDSASSERSTVSTRSGGAGAGAASSAIVLGFQAVCASWRVEVHVAGRNETITQRYSRQFSYAVRKPSSLRRQPGSVSGYYSSHCGLEHKHTSLQIPREGGSEASSS